MKGSLWTGIHSGNNIDNTAGTKNTKHRKIDIATEQSPTHKYSLINFRKYKYKKKSVYE